MGYIVPGLGFAGLGSQTRAVQTLFSQAMRGNSRSTSRAGAPRRKKRAAAASPRKRRRSSKAARLVKGSAAAKRYMAKIRKMRK